MFADFWNNSLRLAVARAQSYDQVQDACKRCAYGVWSWVWWICPEVSHQGIPQCGGTMFCQLQSYIKLRRMHSAHIFQPSGQIISFLKLEISPIHSYSQFVPHQTIKSHHTTFCCFIHPDHGLVFPSTRLYYHILIDGNHCQLGLLWPMAGDLIHVNYKIMQTHITRKYDPSVN